MEKDEDDSGLLGDVADRKHPRTPELVLSWGLAAFFACLSLALYVQTPGSHTSSCPATLRPSDFGPVRPEIESQEVRFTGSPAFREDRSLYVPNPDPITYEGLGPEVDRAWSELIDGKGDTWNNDVG